MVLEYNLMVNEAIPPCRRMHYLELLQKYNKSDNYIWSWMWKKNRMFLKHPKFKLINMKRLIKMLNKKTKNDRLNKIKKKTKMVRLG